MAKTYTSAGTVAAGDVLTAAAFNVVTSDINNLIVAPAVSVYRSSALTGFTTGSAITWQAEHYDTDDMWTSGSGITINTTGLYLINVAGQFTCTASCALLVIEIKRSGTTILSAFQPLLSANESRFCLSGLVDLAAADSLTVTAQMSGGSNYQFAGGATYGEAQTRVSLTWMGKKA
jgi:hypothetical protein